MNTPDLFLAGGPREKVMLCSRVLLRSSAGAPISRAWGQAKKLVEYWRWRYRDSKTGRVCRTLFQLTEAEAQALPKAERIPGSMLLREVEA
jgi:hypothetical protein